MLLCSFCPLVHKQEEAGLGLDAHFPCSSISSHRTILPLPLPIPHIPCVLPQGGTEELEESSQCTFPTVPPEGLHSPLGSSLPNAGGHRWRRTATVLAVPQVWSKSALLAHRPVPQGLLPGVLSL